MYEKRVLYGITPEGKALRLSTLIGCLVLLNFKGHGSNLFSQVVEARTEGHITKLFLYFLEGCSDIKIPLGTSTYIEEDELLLVIREHSKDLLDKLTLTVESCSEYIHRLEVESLLKINLEID